ncbi:unnamed protein product, partial [Ectocarpus sp. 8 AP-2014]
MYTSGIKGLGPVEYVSQKWPVTPYTVVVRNTSSNGNFAQLFVDGQKVAEKNVPGCRSVIFEGIPTGEGIQELLFALPRLSDNCRKYATVSSYKQTNQTDVMATGGAGTGAGEGMRLSSTTR